jgi:hypothetical protein
VFDLNPSAISKSISVCPPNISQKNAKKSQKMLDKSLDGGYTGP